MLTRPPPTLARSLPSLPLPPRPAGLNIPGVAESYDEGGNLKTARWAEGLPEGQSLLDPLDPRR